MKGKKIQPSHLPLYLRNQQPQAFSQSLPNLKNYLHEAEKVYISQVLQTAGQNKSEAARSLGIHRTLLYRKMKNLGLTA